MVKTKGVIIFSAENHYNKLVGGLWNCLLSSYWFDIDLNHCSRRAKVHRLILDSFLSPDKLFSVSTHSVPGKLAELNLDNLLEFLYRTQVTVPQNLPFNLLDVSKNSCFKMLVDTVESKTEKKLDAVHTEQPTSFVQCCRATIAPCFVFLEHLPKKVQRTLMEEGSVDVHTVPESSTVRRRNNLTCRKPTEMHNDCAIGLTARCNCCSNPVASDSLEQPVNRFGDDISEKKCCQSEHLVLEDPTVVQDGSNRVSPAKICNEGHGSDTTDLPNRVNVRYETTSDEGEPDGDRLSDEAKKCQKCQSTFSSSSELERHQQFECGKIFVCLKCGENFDSDKSLAIHSWSHVEEAENKCWICNKICSSIEELQRHERTHDKKSHKHGKALTTITHVIPENREGSRSNTSFKCCRCDKAFSSLADMKSHEFGHRRYSFKCNECGMIFSSTTDLRCHERCHAKHSFKCELCGMAFVRQDFLEEHAVSHTIHLAKWPFHCLLCHASFKFPGQLITHEKVHFNEKHFTCPKCHKCFLIWDNMIQHLADVHGAQVRTGTLSEHLEFVKRTSAKQGSVVMLKMPKNLPEVSALDGTVPTKIPVSDSISVAGESFAAPSSRLGNNSEKAVVQGECQQWDTPANNVKIEPGKEQNSTNELGEDFKIGERLPEILASSRCLKSRKRKLDE